MRANFILRSIELLPNTCYKTSFRLVLALGIASFIRIFPFRGIYLYRPMLSDKVHLFQGFIPSDVDSFMIVDVEEMIFYFLRRLTRTDLCTQRKMSVTASDIVLCKCLSMTTIFLLRISNTHCQYQVLIYLMSVVPQSLTFTRWTKLSSTTKAGIKMTRLKHHNQMIA